MWTFFESFTSSRFLLNYLRANKKRPTFRDRGAALKVCVCVGGGGGGGSENTFSQ